MVLSQIIQRSGNRSLDRSVQRVLDQIKTIGLPFPESSREQERTYTIEFNLKVKRATG